MKYTLLSTDIQNYVNLTVEGEKLEGIVTRLIKNIATVYGQVDMLELKHNISGSYSTIVLTSNLKFIDWQALLGKTVCITYQGLVLNEKTNHSYKKYQVLVGEE